MSTPLRLKQLLSEWQQSSPKSGSGKHLSRQIMGLTSELIKSNSHTDLNKSFWIDWLNITSKTQFLSSLKKEDLNNWAQLAFILIQHTQFSFRDLMELRVREHPRKLLFREISGSTSSQWSYEHIHQHIQEIATLFYSLHSEAPRIAIWSENNVEAACCDLACLCYGILVTPLNIHLDPPTIQYIIEELKINIIVTDTQNRVDQLESLREKTGQKFKCLVLDQDIDTDDQNIFFLYEYCKRFSQKEIAAILDKKPRPINQVATVMYTSGSTGMPKGVSFSNYNIISKRFARAAALPRVGRNEVFLCYLPLYHTFGRFLELTGTIFWGGTYVFAGNPSAETLFSLFPKINPTAFISIPLRWTQLYEKCLEEMSRIPDPDMQEIALRSVIGSRLRWGLSAAGYLDPAIFQFFQSNGVELCSGFGLTEATGGVTMTPPGKYIANTHGLPLPGVEVRFGKKNELHIRGHYIARYLEDKKPGDIIPFPKNTKSDYWLHTGDLFQVTKEGYFAIIDRIKDIYKNSKGQTIAPRKVEDKFLNVPGIKRTFLVGDARPFNVLFIIPDRDDPILKTSLNEENEWEYFHQIVTAANHDLAPYERVINFAILDRDFSIGEGELTPKGSFNRKTIVQNLSNRIDELYHNNYVELSRYRMIIRIPRWFYRDRGLIEGDIEFQQKGLIDRSNNQTLLVKRNKKDNSFQIGDLIYKIDGDVIDLGILARQPALWVGNPQLIAFCPIKEGWDTPFNSFDNLVQRPLGYHMEYSTEQLPRLEAVRNPILIKANNLISIMLFSDTDTTRAAMKQLRIIMSSAEVRLTDIIRQRLECLARHPEESVRVFAYQILLMDDPRPSHVKTYPVFIESGLSFLNQESIESIAFSKLETRRLEALRRRLLNYRLTLNWPAGKTMQQQFEKIFELLVSFVNYHPEFYNPIRAELASWILHKADAELADKAGKHFKKLFKNFEARLEAETPKYHEKEWLKRIIFEDGLSPSETARIKKVLINTTFLKQSIMLAFDEIDFDLMRVPEGGIWISRLSVSHHYLLYRMSINLNNGKHFDLQLVLRETLQTPSVLESVHWLESVAGYPYGPPVLPRLGCYRPELGARSMVYINETSVWGKIRQISSVHFTGGPFPNPKAWMKLFLEAMAVFYRGWQNSGELIIPGVVFPHNVVVPELDFRESAMILSLIGWVKYKNPLSLIEPLLKNFYLKTVAHYPWCKDQLDETWIFDACIEALGKDKGLSFLKKLRTKLKTKSLFCLDGSPLIDLLDKYMANLESDYYRPLALFKAVDRYHNWASVNPSATPAAREQTILDLFKLYRLDRFPEICRYHLYRATYFSKTGKETTTAFDKLLAKMALDIEKPAIQLLELSDLQSSLKKPHDREIFSHMVFPRFHSRKRLEVLKIGEQEGKQVIVYSYFTDRYGASYTVREPVKPAEIGQLYRLFLNENFPKTISEYDKHLIVTDANERIVGGLCYQFRSNEVVQLEGTVVAAALKERGIGTALIEDFCNRMESQSIHVIIAHFFLRHFYLKLGFKVDKRWGALVKFLTPENVLPDHTQV